MRREINALPQWAERFLRWICSDELYEEIEGDLIETVNRKLEESGFARANWFLFVNVLKYCRLGILLRRKQSYSIFNGAVVQSYFLTSYRHILKDKVNAIFKMAGLTLALFTVIIVVLYVSYQLSFDRYHEGYERIYRVNTQRLENGNIEQYGIAPAAFGPMLQNNFPEIESFARLDISNGSHLKYKDKVVFGGVFPADSSLFDVFSFKFIKGSGNALARPNTIVLTSTLAKNIFGDEEPLHKILTINNDQTLYQVTGVIEDIPDNSHFRVEAFVPFKRKEEFNADYIISPPGFVDNAVVLFIKLKETAKPQGFINNIDKTLDNFVPRKQREELGYKVWLQPLKDIYLDPPLKYEFTRKGSMVYLYIFSVLGAFLLIVSCINYANLSLAGFMNRSREMGIRKVMGARKSQIISQIFVETFLYAIIACVLSSLMVLLLFPQIVEYIEPHLSILLMTTRSFRIVMLSVVLLIIVLAATIPSVWFATNKISNDLKGIYAGNGKMGFSNWLLLIQFCISAICMSSTLTIGRQIDFIHHKDLGIDRKDLLVLSMSEDFTVDKMKTLKTSLKTIPGVVHVSNSSFRMGGGFWKDWYSVEVKNEMKSFELYEVFSDDELFETLGMKILKGRVFQADHPADSGAAFVINETAATELGLENPIGTRILTHPEEPGKWEGTIVGVVNDINIASLHHKVQPLVMRLPWQNDYPEYFVYVRINGPAEAIIKSIKSKYNQLNPGYPLEIHFVDDFYNQEYDVENRAYASLQFGTMIIMLISSLGIFSLSIYFSIRRMKEFGIRKVLGASATQISMLHVSHFFRMAALSMLIALPVAYMMMNEWLMAFAYHVHQDMGIMILVLAITLCLIAVSAGYAAMRAGRMSPVDVINKV